MSVRDSFVARFGEDQAARFEDAANGHVGDLLAIQIGDERGSDPFKWVLLQVISFQCAEVESYRRHHSITAPWEEVKAWIKSEAKLGQHDGAYDAVGLMSGCYSEFLGGGGQ